MKHAATHAAERMPSQAGRRWLRVVLLSALILIIASMQGCNQLFYHPNAHRYRAIDSIPGAEDVTFASQDGTRLHAWFLPARGTRKGTVIYFHGNAQNLTSHISFVDWLPAEGFDVFAFDYRGYGQSGGAPSRQGLHEDSLAALDYVSGRSDVDANRIVAFGQSLGGACAAAALGESSRSVRGLALDSTFAHYIGMGNEAIGGAWLTYPLAWLLLSNAHSPADSIARLSPTPVLCIHSPHDPVVPIAQGRALYEAAGEPKAFLELPTHGHPVATSSQAGRARLLEFFQECLAGA